MTADAPARLALPRSMRMQLSREFAAVRSRGKRLAKGCLAINWMPLDDGARSKLGVITSRKLGKAVVRTRARRLMKETFRRHQNELRGPVAMVLVARQSIVGKGLAAVDRDFLNLARQAGLILTNK